VLRTPAGNTDTGHCRIIAGIRLVGLIDISIVWALSASRCTTDDHAAALQRFLVHYAADRTAHAEVYAGVPSMLDFLKARGVSSALLTRKPARLTHAILRRLGLDGYFIRVVAGDSLPFRKPDPRVLLEILWDVGANAGESLMVGDSEIDAATAQAAGAPFAPMTHGYHRSPPEEIPSVARFEDFKALRVFIEARTRS
jgi:phosphoglycolate phosphatase